MSDDPSGGKRLQIDDLIIIPNNMSAGSEGAGGAGGPNAAAGGSALQNLAKIASRYQDTGTNNSDGGDSQNLPSPQKKARMDTAQKPPSSNLTATQLAGILL